MAVNFERLFLLEFMVHEVTFSNLDSMDPNFLKSLGATCIQFYGENFPPIDLCEEEFTEGPYEATRTSLECGKSCFFAMSKGEGEWCDCAKITVSKKLPPGGCTDLYRIGVGQLKLTPDFLDVLDSVSCKSNTTSCSNHMNLTVDLCNKLEDKVGAISIFLRLTCFGTEVFTVFKPNSINENKFSFKGDEFTKVTEIEEGKGVEEVKSGGEIPA